MRTPLPNGDNVPQLVALLDALPHMMLIRAGEDGIVYANHALRAQTGLAAVADGWIAVVHPEDRPAAALHFAAAARGSTPALTLRLLNPAGGHRRYLSMPGRSPMSSPLRFVCLAFAEQDEASASVPATRALALRDAMLDAVPECVELIAADGTLLHANRAGLAAHASAGDAATGEWLGALPAAARHRRGRALRKVLGPAPTAERTRFRLTTEGPGQKPRHVENTLVPLRDESGTTVAVVNVGRDVTAIREAEQRLRAADRTDSLTRVWNRREFKQRLAGSIARASVEGGAIGVLVADLDHFKHVNEMFGDPAGDHLLRTLGNRIRSVIPEDAYVARLGGDEFAVAVPGLRDEAELLSVANAVLGEVDTPIFYQGALLRGAVSIGCAIYPRDAADMSSLLKCADAALTDLKDGGRGRAQVFKQRMLDDATLVAEQLRTAWDVVRRNVIVPFYQLKVRLDDHRIVGLEALLRWRDEDGALHYPGEIVEAFNHYDLATRIADAMQEKVLADIAAWLEAGLHVVPVSINAAPVEFLRGDYAERLLGRLDRFGVPASMIEVEVTEHSLTARSARAVAHALRTLKAAGVRIALDDFGAGHSSLVHLRDYSIDVIKLDRNFVAGMMDDAPMAAIVETICALAPRLHLEVVAEGVETAGQAERLMPWGCNVGQGFLFGEAEPAHVAITRLGSP